MSSDTNPSPAAWRLQTLTIPALPSGIDPFDAMRQVEHFYATEPSEDLAAARAGDYLEGLLPASRRIAVTKRPCRRQRGALETEFVARVINELRYLPDQIRVNRGEIVQVSGRAMCEVCGCIHSDHAPVQGYPRIRRACDGRLLKL